MHDQLGHITGGAFCVDAALGVQRRHVAAPHHHHPVITLLVTLFPGVDHVVQVTRREVEPADAVAGAKTRNHAQTRAHLGVKFDLVPPKGHGVMVMEQRQVMQHRVVLGDGHVVRQARAGQLNRHMVFELAVGAHHAIVHVGGRVAVVKEHHLFSELIDLGVGGNLGALAGNGGRLAQGSQRDRVDLIGVARHVPQRQRAAAVAHHVGVGRVFEALVFAALEGFADAVMRGVPGFLFFQKRFGAHPAVAVGQLALVEVRRMHHAVAVKRVVTAVRCVTRVGAGAQVDAIEVFGNAALDELEVRQCQLVKHWRVNAGEQRAMILAKWRQVFGGGACVHGDFPAKRCL